MFVTFNFAEWCDKEGNTLLHACIGYKFVEGVEFLIQNGANVNA